MAQDQRSKNRHCKMGFGHTTRAQDKESAIHSSIVLDELHGCFLGQFQRRRYRFQVFKRALLLARRNMGRFNQPLQLALLLARAARHALARL